MNRATMQRLLALTAVILVLVAACSVPEDGSPTVLNSDVMPVVPTPTPQTFATTQRVIYLFDEETERLVEVTREVEDPVTVVSLLAELSELPTDVELEEGLVSVLSIDTQLVPESQPTIIDRVMTIDLLATGLPALEPGVQLRALAQLVWTITVREDVDSVKINVEGQGQNWPTSGDDKPENQPLNRADYNTLDPAFEAEPPPTPGNEPIVEGETPVPENEDG